MSTTASTPPRATARIDSTPEASDSAFAVFLTDPAGIVSSWSPGAAGVAGYTAAEIVGRELSILYPADSLADGHPFTDLAHAARRGRAVHEGWLIHKSGDRVWAEIVITALRDAQGMVSAFACCARDLTSVREAEAARSAQAEQISALAGGSDVLTEAGLDLRALLPRIAGRAMDLTGADAAVLELRDGVGDRARAHAGAPDFEIELGSILMPHMGILPEMRPPVLRYDDRHESPEILGDVCDRAGIGAMLAVPIMYERSTLGWLAVLARSAQAFEDQQASTLALVAALLGAPIAQAQSTETKRTLVAERSRAQAAHRESEARFRAAMDSSLDAIFIVSAVRDTRGGIIDFTLLDANRRAREWCGVRRDNFEGKRLSALPSVARHLAAVTDLAKVAEQGAPSEDERRLTEANGTVRWLQEQVVPFGDGVMITLHDVTSRVEAEAEVHRAREVAEMANRAKTEFVARMSHELRTPLNSVIGFSNILLRNRRKALDDGELSYLSRIQSSGTHLLALINDVLDIAKIEAGHMTLEISEVDVVALVGQVIFELDTSAQAGGLAVEVETTHPVMIIAADAGKLRQVMFNLIANAIKFTPAGKVLVRIAGTPAPDHAATPESIEIIDTGIGIPEDRLHAIFDAFEQAESSTSRRYGGTGLGLSISRALCEAMGFTLTVESTLGRGSTFRVGLSG